MWKRMCDVFLSAVVAGVLYSACGIAQAPAQNPTCPTRPTGDSTNACASTAFVQGAVGPSCTGLGAFVVGTGASRQCSTAAGSTAAVAGPLTLTPTAGSRAPALLITQTQTGTATAGQYYANNINITDSADWTSGGNSGNYGFWVSHNVTGGNGGRAAIYGQMAVSGVVGALNPYYTGVSGVVQASGANPTVSFYGSNFAAVTTAAVAVGELIASEINTGLIAGSSAGNKVGIQIVQINTDAVSGTTVDTALRLANQVGAVGWINGIQFDNLVAAPVKNTGSLIKTVGAWTVLSGVDISSLTVTNAFKSNQFLVDGSGNTKATTYYLGASPTLFAELLAGFNVIHAPNGSIKMLAGDNTNLSVYGDTISFNNAAGSLIPVTINSSGLQVLGARALAIGGASTGTVSQQYQSTATNAVVTWGTATGTPAVTASAPLAITSATGNITCATCLTSSSTLNLVVGTTTVGSGTTTRILYDNAGVLGEYTLTGTGTVVAMQTSPTFVTQVTVPKIIGGSGTTGTQLTFQTTTGVGTTDGFTWLGGNAGGTSFMTLASAGIVLSATSASAVRVNAVGVDSYLVFDTSTTGLASGIQLLSNAVTKWIVQNSATNLFNIYDNVNGIFSVQVTSGAAAAGKVAIGYTTTSTSKTTGSLVNSGGFGNAGTLFTDTLNIITVANASTTAALCWNSGTGLVTENAAVGTCTVSDERLKNMGPRIVGALEKLLRINGVYFTWKDPLYGSGLQIGVGAQTVAAVFPELVHMDDEGKLSADYQRLTAPIIEALRELKADNDNLQQELKELRRTSK